MLSCCSNKGGQKYVPLGFLLSSLGMFCVSYSPLRLEEAICAVVTNTRLGLKEVKVEICTRACQRKLSPYLCCSLPLSTYILSLLLEIFEINTGGFIYIFPPTSFTNFINFQQ